MPTYEYECTKCGKELEVFQSMKEAPLKKCPACGKSTLRRKISGGSGLIFKGTGFYITDYKNKKSAAKSEGADKPAPAKTSDSKPAASAAK
ncbi:MAG TPA: zinc ribbon domain-containing protein [Candidatus Didemnitutus sp.]|nr:zinc ribbon domain-containing protein [Candidatus Didemnitutus sp.]